MGRRLRYLRELKDEIQEKCSKHYNVSRTTYARRETNKDYMPLEKIIIACNFNKVSIDYITGLSNINTYTSKLVLNKKGIDKSLIKLRKEILHYTQEKFSNSININQSTYSAYEMRKRTGTLSFIFFIMGYI